jgi:hypothetical protein
MLRHEVSAGIIPTNALLDGHLCIFRTHSTEQLRNSPLLRALHDFGAENRFTLEHTIFS